MARTVAEIKKTMTDAFMADATIKSKYGFADGDLFEEKFSNVSLENLLFFIVAASIYLLEVMMDSFMSDVDEKVRTAVVASVPWYHKLAKAFQYGDSLIYDSETMTYKYEDIDPSLQIIKYAAVQDMGTSVKMLVSKESDSLPAVLSDDELTAFKAYMSQVKIIGVILNIQSLPPDSITIFVKVKVDVLMYNSDGTLISDNISTPVKTAIKDYLKNIVYGGTFNKTKLVDAIQAVEGVEDVELGMVSVGDTVVSGNNYTSAGGSFVLNSNSVIGYEL